MADDWLKDGALVGGSLLAGNLDRVLSFFRGLRQERREDKASEADVFSKMRAEVSQMLEMSERQCEARMKFLASELEFKFDRQVHNLRSLVYALATKAPLDAKMKALLAEIAPDQAG